MHSRMYIDGLKSMKIPLSSVQFSSGVCNKGSLLTNHTHDDVIKWKHFPRHWPFVRGIHRSPVNSPHKGHWRGPLLFLWSAPEPTVEQTMYTPVFRRHRPRYDVTVMSDIQFRLYLNNYIPLKLQLSLSHTLIYLKRHGSWGMSD